MKNAIYLSLLFFSLTFFACQSDSSTGTSTTSPNKTLVIKGKLEPATFKRKLAASPDALLIDVRTPQEFDQGHLDNALNIDYHGDDFDQKMAALDKSKPVFLYCKSGGRSGKTFHKLKKMGFKDVYDMKGGYTAWSELK